MNRICACVSIAVTTCLFAGPTQAQSWLSLRQAGHGYLPPPATGLLQPVADLGDVGGGLGGGLGGGGGGFGGGGGGPGGGSSGGSGGNGDGGTGDGGSGGSDHDSGGGANDGGNGGSVGDPGKTMVERMADLREAEKTLQLLEADVTRLELAQPASLPMDQTLIGVEIRVAALQVKAVDLPNRLQSFDRRLLQLRDRLEAIEASAPATPEDQYEQAQQLLTQNRVVEAQRLFREVLAAQPGEDLTAKARFGLGETFFRREDYATAGWVFAQGYQQDSEGPLAADSLLKLGMALAHLDKKTEACAAFDKVQSDYPDDLARVGRA